MPNNINTLSPDFRDFLLQRNIISDSIENNGLTPLLQGIGYPADVFHTPESVNPSGDIETDGVFHKDLNVVQSKFQVEDSEYRFVGINNIPGDTTPFSVTDDSNSYQQLNTTQNTFRADDNDYVDVSIYLNTSSAPTIQMGSYLNEYGELNVGGPSTEPIDLIGSIISGNGVGFSPNGGIVSDYDVRSSLAGRILTSTGLINDTKLGQLSVGYLATALGNNVAFNVQQETLGHVNLNPLSLIKGGNVIRPNFNITVAKGTLGVGVDLLERILGFETPISLLERGSSIFVSESGNISTIDRANSLIDNTGKGQILSLFSNLNANSDETLIGERIGFVPDYEDDRTERGFNQGPLNGGEGYAFNNNSVIEKYTSELEGGFNEEFGDSTLGPEFSVRSNHWIDENNNIDRDSGTVIEVDRFNNKKSLLYKTQELFKSNKMKTLTSGHHVKKEVRSDIQSAVREGGFMSKGSGVLAGGRLDSNNEKIFCRTWSSNDRYNQITDLQKHSGIDPLARQNGETYTNSVLDDNGMVKIGPYKGDEVKRFMFSIENLAWVGETDNLLKCEVGEGDLLTGNKGRIMWFPPYEMSFNETTSVNWDKSNFIGRGEPVYTYNNTERTGTLSWKIIIDHPNYMNFMSDLTSDEIDSFFSGCLEHEGIRESVLSKKQIEEMKVSEATKRVSKTDNESIDDFSFNLYFSNDNSDIPTLYENGLKNGSDTPTDLIDFNENPAGVVSNTLNYGVGTTSGQGIVGSVREYKDNTNFGLNGQSKPLTIGDVNVEGGWQDSNFVTTLNSYLKDKCKYCRINISGYASNPGASDKNQTLSKNRANSVKDWILSSGILDGDSIGEERVSISAQGVGETESGGSGCIQGQEDSEPCKGSRTARVTVTYDSLLKEDDNPSITNIDLNSPSRSVSVPISKFYTECNYFEKMEQTDNFVYDNIKQKIPFFHPGFHSITPEGFNSRLTFLQQCTRQGPTRNLNTPDNLAFGRPPVCILRIGDFYHTKIVIDSLTFDYEPLVWDLNPEGVGVQPMIVTVNMSFAFIGGSSLNSPINKLQNAISYNYFANTEMYDPRAHKVKVKADSIKGSAGELIEGVFPNAANRLEESNLKDGIGNNPEVIVSQSVVSEDEISKNSQEIDSTEDANVNDSDIISDILLLTYNKEIGDDVLRVALNFSHNSGGYNLSGDFNSNVIVNVLGDSSQLNLGKIEAIPNDNSSFIIRSNNNLGISEVVVNKNNRTPIIMKMLLSQSDVEIIDNIILLGNGALSVNWNTGHKTKINLKKEVGI